MIVNGDRFKEALRTEKVYKHSERRAKFVLNQRESRKSAVRSWMYSLLSHLVIYVDFWKIVLLSWWVFTFNFFWEFMSM